MQMQLIALTGGARQDLRLREMQARLQRVIAAEIGAFAHFGHGIGVGAAAFADDERDELGHAAFEEIGGCFEMRCTRGGRRLRPVVEGARRAADGILQVGVRCGRERSVGGYFLMDRVEDIAPREVDAKRVQPVGIEVARQRNARVGRVRLRQLRERVGNERLERYLGVGDLVHE